MERHALLGMGRSLQDLRRCCRKPFLRLALARLEQRGSRPNLFDPCVPRRHIVSIRYQRVRGGTSATSTNPPDLSRSWQRLTCSMRQAIRHMSSKGARRAFVSLSPHASTMSSVTQLPPSTLILIQNRERDILPRTSCSISYSILAS
jgi:hypothetical protein